MSELRTLLADINNCCQKIAEKEAFELKNGGYVKKPNSEKWSFVRGKGSYEYKNGGWQWKLA